MSDSTKLTESTGGDVLTALATQIRRAHRAITLALHEALDHAMAAGDALIAAHGQVKHGEWSHWLKRHCDLRERTARRYIQLARARQVLEANRSRATDLSLAGALRLLSNKAGRSHPATKSPKQTEKLSSLAWSDATPAERRTFLDAIGLVSLLAAIPPTWQAEIERRVEGQRKARTSQLSDAVTKALRQALSLQRAHKDKDGPAPGVAAALNTINNLIAKAGADLNEISGITLDERLTKTARKAA